MHGFSRACTFLGFLAALCAAAQPVPPWSAFEQSVMVRVTEQVQRLSVAPDADKQDRSSRPAKASSLGEGNGPGISSRQAHPAAVDDSAWLFSSGGRNDVPRTVSNVENYRPMMERIFAEEGVPKSLLSIGLVESAYNPTAKSPKGAVGIWQFIPETARQFGLSVEGRDERTDPLKSTVAAARYLRFLYQNLGDWPLVLAAYNAGEQRVSAAIQKAGSRNFWDLARLGLLPRETREYVPAVMAAQLLPDAAVPTRNPASRPESAGWRVYASMTLSADGK